MAMIAEMLIGRFGLKNSRAPAVLNSRSSTLPHLQMATLITELPFI